MSLLKGKNIVFLLKSFVLGGAEKQALFLAGYLQNKMNCNVFIYSYIKSESRELFDAECDKYRLENLYVEPNPLSAAGKLKYLKRRVKLNRFGKKIRKHQPDIIIPYLNPPSIIANMCYKVAKANKTFWHHRGVDYYRNDSIERLASKRAKYFIANSKNGAEELKKELNIKGKKINTLPNFSTIQKNNSSDKGLIKGKYGISKDDLVIGMIAHFRSEKRQRILFEACFKLFDKYPKLHLVLVGNMYTENQITPDLEFINSLKEELKLKKRVTILHQTNATEVLPMFDVGVLLSDKEGMPNVVMEYMAYKLPVLTNSHDGCVELLGEDYECFVNNDVKEVEIKLEDLIENENIRRSIGKKNHERLNSKFSIENYIIKLEEILNT